MWYLVLSFSWLGCRPVTAEIRGFESRQYRNLIINNMTRYLLVEWPESQEFIGMDGCYFCQCNDENSFGDLDQALFVPEELYNQKMHA